MFDLFGASFKYPLKNVSGPSTVLTGTTADSYKFCVAERAGECASGSAAGEVYVNVPNVTLLACAGGDSSPTALDACIGNVPMYGHTLSQYGLRPGNVLQQGDFPTYGARWSRTLVTLTGEYRMITPYASGKSFADGSWIMLPTRWSGNNPNGHVMIAKVPPYPSTAPAVDMSTFVDAKVEVADPTSAFPGTANVVVQFGYWENGNPDQFHCTQRSEACVKGAQGGTGFAFESESVMGVTCTTGCSVTLPLIPDRLAFYRVVYRNSVNWVIGKGPLGIVGPSGVVASAPPGPVTPSSPSRPRNVVVIR